MSSPAAPATRQQPTNLPTVPQPTHQHHNTAHSSAPRASTRLSTFSITPTLAPSIAPSHLSTTPSLTPSEKSSPLAADMRVVTASLARLDEPRLQQQRYVVSEGKSDEFSLLALGATVERALGRRMVGQDAVFTKKKKKPVKKDGAKLVKAGGAA